jgi:hypothetical protein
MKHDCSLHFHTRNNELIFKLMNKPMCTVKHKDAAHKHEMKLLKACPEIHLHFTFSGSFFFFRMVSTQIQSGGKSNSLTG